MMPCTCPEWGHRHANARAGLAWHPEAMLGAPLDGVNLATGSADSTAKLWSLEGKCLSSLAGHTDRCRQPPPCGIAPESHSTSVTVRSRQGAKLCRSCRLVREHEVLCCAVLCCAVLCCAVLCCAVM